MAGKAVERRMSIMKKRSIIIIALLLLVACCLFVHRRVIKALLRHEPLPKAPGWHFWVAAGDRRSDTQQPDAG